MLAATVTVLASMAGAGIVAFFVTRAVVYREWMDLHLQFAKLRKRLDALEQHRSGGR